MGNLLARVRNSIVYQQLMWVLLLILVLSALTGQLWLQRFETQYSKTNEDALSAQAGLIRQNLTAMLERVQFEMNIYLQSPSSRERIFKEESLLDSVILLRWSPKEVKTLHQIDRKPETPLRVPSSQELAPLFRARKPLSLQITHEGGSTFKAIQLLPQDGLYAEIRFDLKSVFDPYQGLPFQWVLPTQGQVFYETPSTTKYLKIAPEAASLVGLQTIERQVLWIEPGPIGTSIVLFMPKTRSAVTMDGLIVPLILLFVGLAFLFNIYQKRIRNKISRLRRELIDIAEGESMPPLRDRDEFSSLSDAFGEIHSRVQSQVQSAVQSVIADEEKKMADSVRENLIPPTQYGDSNLEVFSHYRSAKGCGGDWWGFFQAQNKICIMIADATGHGISSALVTAATRSCFSMMHRFSQENPQFPLNPSDIMAYVNKVVYDIASTKIMMTLFVGVIDLKEKTLTYSNAGHNPPWLYQPSEQGIEQTSLVAEGIRLGESLSPPAYEEKTVPIKKGDLIVLYTDGLLDNKNLEGEPYGKKRARKAIEASLANGPRATLQALIDDVTVYGEGKSLDDDVTVAVFRLLAQ